MQYAETKNTAAYWKKFRRHNSIWSKTRKGNRPQKDTNDVRKTDKGIFQRIVKKSQKKSW